MKIRGILQHELWSKRTNWKILAALAVVLVLGYGTFEAYYRYWISREVRESGKRALDQIDELQGLATSCGAAFDAKAARAHSEISFADRGVHTFRDVNVLFLLSNYLSAEQIKYLRTCKQQMNPMEQKHPDFKNLSDRIVSSEAELKLQLHKELD